MVLFLIFLIKFIIFSPLSFQISDIEVFFVIMSGSQNVLIMIE